MEQNVGTSDKIIRIIIAAIFAVLGYFVNAWFYLGTIILGITAFIGFCTVYKLLGVNTVKKKNKK